MSFIYSSISDFIFMEGQIKPADIILIPGGSHIELIEQAAKLYNDGLAQYILPSGGKNLNLIEYSTEGEFLVESGIQLGIPREAFLREDKASHTFGNAENSLRVIKENCIVVNKAILVCKSFHARRAYLTYATIFPSNIEFIVSPVIDSRNIRKDNWYLDSEKTHRVMSEVVKIGSYFEKHIENMN